MSFKYLIYFELLESLSMSGHTYSIINYKFLKAYTDCRRRWRYAQTIFQYIAAAIDVSNNK